MIQLLLSILLNFGMYYSTFSGDINDLHRRPSSSKHFKYSILGGYTGFSLPYARFSMVRDNYTFGLFMLSSGKLVKTDAQGQVIGSVYYNGIRVSVGKTVYEDEATNELYMETALYTETADGWFNPGLGLNVRYRRMIYRGFLGEVYLRNFGFSMNTVELIDFDAIFSIAYQKYGIDPFFSINVSPERKIKYYTGLTLPIHSVFSTYIFYTNAFKELSFGSGSDILNGLSLGMDIKTSSLELMYIADFHGETGVSHTVEIRFFK